MTTIAMIGAGNVGGNLGARLSKAGAPVRFGVREGADAREALARCADDAEALPVREAAAAADVIFVAVPGGVAIEAAKGLGDVSGKVVVDCTNPLRFDGGPVWTPPAEGSNAAAIAAALEGARVLKGFNTFGAELHADPALSAGPVDVQLAGDDAEAKAMVSELAERAGFRPIDAGTLRNAAVLENLAVLWIHLALVGGHGREVGFKLVGR
ncbi:MAG TPA: NAD(P)-binding domain-containing protein [Sandaracinaceae bacterium LLY-WYZ-13_1]|nr:NAD(P)-binding domain-containing protein [Sandaracinaceae bacterium LLY-WYZ-13_1]